MKMAWKKSAIAFLVLTALGLALPNGLSYGTNVNVKAEAEEDTTVPEYLHFTVVENYNTPERYYAMLKSCDKDYKGIVTIPNKVDGKTVKAIAQSAFLNCTGIENVIIPDSVEMIGNGAFFGCTSLKNITLPKGILGIENNAFENCTGLTSISIPESVVHFGNNVFKGCTSLKELNVPVRFQDKVIDVFSETGMSLSEIIEALKSDKYTLNVKQVGFTAQGDDRYSDEAFWNNQLSGETAYYIGGNSTTGCGVIFDRIPIVPWAPERYGKINVINKEEKIILSADYDRSFVWWLDDTIASVCTDFYGKETDGYDEQNESDFAALKNAHYYDTEGNEMSFTTGSVMMNGIAAILESVSSEKNSGGGAHILSFINSKGEKVLTLDTPVILEHEAYTEGAMYYHGSNYHMNFGGFSENLILFSCDRQFGSTLNDLITDEGEDTYKKSEHAYGYADLNGNIVIAQAFDDASPFRDGLAKVGIKDEATGEMKYGFIDKTGEFIVKPQYAGDPQNGGTGEFHEGLARVARKNGKEMICGYVDKSGEFVIATQYEAAGDFSNGFAKVKKDGKWGYINTKDEIVIPYEYTEAYDSDGNCFVVGKKFNGTTKYGAIDAEGNTILPFIFEDMSNSVNGSVYAFYNKELYSIEISGMLETGDLTGDGEISVEDAQLTLRAYTEHVAGLESKLTPGQKKAADINGDGEVSVEDAQLILRYYTEKTVAGKDITWDDLLKQ